MSENSGPRLQRAQWRSRRGLLELELLLAPFVNNRFGQVTEALKSDYETLLDFDDMDVHEWLLDRAEVPPEMVPIVTEIRRFLAES